MPIGWESDYHIESAARFFFNRTENGAAVFDAGSGGVGLAALTWPPKWPPVGLRRQRLKHGLPMTVSDVLPPRLVAAARAAGLWPATTSLTVSTTMSATELLSSHLVTTGAS